MLRVGLFWWEGGGGCREPGTQAHVESHCGAFGQESESARNVLVG